MSQGSLFLDEPDAGAASAEFDDLTGDGGVLKRTLFPGTGATPPADAVALLHLQSAVHPGGAPLHCSLDTAGWYRLDLRSALTDVRGLELGAAAMRKGEVAELVCAAPYAFGAAGDADLGVPPGAAVRFEVRLFGWETTGRRELPGAAELVAWARRLKAVGAERCAAGRWADARRLYAEGARVLGDADFDKSAYAAGRLAPAARGDAADLALALWRNEALCCLKLDEWREAEAACSRVLDRRTQDAKALYRRGVARTRLGDVDGALADLRAASALEPDDRSIRDALGQCRAAAAEAGAGLALRLGG